MEPDVAPQAETLTCLRCGGQRLMENVGLIVPPAGLPKACLPTSKGNFFSLPKFVYADMTVHICADCGHTELVTGNLAELWKVYSQENR